LNKKASLSDAESLNEFSNLELRLIMKELKKYLFTF